jgi:hypothetical protein
MIQHIFETPLVPWIRSLASIGGECAYSFSEDIFVKEVEDWALSISFLKNA